MKFRRSLYMTSRAVVPLAALLLGVTLFSFLSYAKAIEQVGNETALLNGTGSVELNSTGNSDIPMLEQLSDKGIYLVQLRWAQLQLSADQSISMELVFQNASIPRNETIPLTDQQSTGHENEVGSGAIEVPNSVPVKSYDIAIYADDGRQLWNKTEQPAQGGRGGQVVPFANYTGPINVEVTNIIPGWDTGDVNPEEMKDSVTFSAVVVPEFPVVGVVMATAIGAMIVLASRFKLRSLGGRMYPS